MVCEVGSGVAGKSMRYMGRWDILDVCSVCVGMCICMYYVYFGIRFESKIHVFSYAIGCFFSVVV